MIDLERLHLHFGRCVIIQVTAACPLSCAHCIVSSSPERTEQLDRADLLGLIDNIAEAGRTQLIVLSGGEPFLKRDRLIAALARIKAHGLSAGVVTSAHWAGSPDRAREVLSRLPAGVIADLCVSADRHHLEFMSLEPVRHALEAALALGIPASLFVCLDSRHDDFPGRLRETLGESLLDQIRVRVTPTHRSGRGADHPALAGVGEPVAFEDLPDEACHGPATPAVTPDGSVMACCGDTMSDPQNWPALRLSEAGSPGFERALARSDGDPLIQAIRLAGPKQLARIAIARGVLDPAGRRFDRRNICDVCRWVTGDRRAAAAVRAHYRQAGEAERLEAQRLVCFGEAATGEQEAAE